MAEAKLAEPFSDLLAADLLDEPPRESEFLGDQSPGRVAGKPLVAGSISGYEVGAAGFEPATSRV